MEFLKIAYTLALLINMDMMKIMVMELPIMSFM